jgi:hypothetical protein
MRMRGRKQERKSKSRNTKIRQPLPSLEELGFVIQEGNIIHRTHQKLRILRAHYRRSARDMSEQGRLKKYEEQLREKQIQAEIARVAKEDTKQEVEMLKEVWHRKHPGQAITRHINEKVHERAKSRVDTRMAGQYGKDIAQKLRGRRTLAPLPTFPQKEKKGGDVDGRLAGMLSKLGMGSAPTMSTTSLPVAHGRRGYGIFYDPCIDAARNRVGQSPQWKIELLDLATLFLPYVEAINERFICACFLDLAAGCRPYVVSDAYEAAKHLVQSMAHLPVSFIHDILEQLAQAADAGYIPQQYLDGMANAALDQATTTLSLLSDTIPPNAAERVTPSSRSTTSSCARTPNPSP